MKEAPTRLAEAPSLTIIEESKDTKMPSYKSPAAQTDRA